MDALASAIAEITRNFSNTINDGKDENSQPGTQSKTQLAPEERPWFHSFLCLKFDIDEPAEFPAFADLASSATSSSATSSILKGTTLDQGDLIWDLQERRSHSDTDSEQIVFFEDFNDMEGDHTTVSSKGMQNKTFDGYNQNHDDSGITSANTSDSPTQCPPDSASGKFLKRARQTRKRCICAIVLGSLIVGIILVTIGSVILSRGKINTNNSAASKARDPPAAESASALRTPSPTISPTRRTASPTISTTPVPSTTRIVLPAWPELRFTPFSLLPESIAQDTILNVIGYDSETWDLPGSVNNGDNNDGNIFWEGFSFGSIQSLSVNASAAIVGLNMTAQQWDCWSNHYQDFTFDDLLQESEIEIVFVEGEEGEGSVSIGGRNLQEAMRVLGWTDANWNTDERIEYFFPQGTNRGQRPAWDELTVAEQLAATTICWNRELWERIPIPLWG